MATTDVLDYPWLVENMKELLTANREEYRQRIRVDKYPENEADNIIFEVYVEALQTQGVPKDEAKEIATYDFDCDILWNYDFFPSVEVEKLLKEAMAKE